MAETTTIARPYAEAAAQLAEEGGNWRAWSDMLALAAGVAADPKFAAAAANPEVSAERLARIVIAVCGDKLTAAGANLVRLLAANKRLPSLPEIARLFEERKAAQEGALDARITTAYPLSADQLARLVAKLEARFGLRVEAVQEVDPALIGGLVIQVGDEVMDVSVRGRLAAMNAVMNVV